PEAERAEGATEDRAGVVDRAARGDGCHPVQSRHSADQIEGALERRDRHARAERGGVRVSAEGEVARAERRRRTELAVVVALGSAGTGRIALLAASRVHHPVAATPTHLGGARRGAAVAAERVAIVALLARVDDPVATARRRAIAVAVAGSAVEHTVVAPLARVDDAVATVGDALALGVAPPGEGWVALFAAHRVHDPVAAAEPGLDRAGGRAAVAAHRVAVVALLGAAHDAVAAAGDERAGIAAAVAVVRVAVVALLARLDVAVARRSGRPGREVVDLPALDRGIEAAEDTRAVSGTQTMPSAPTRRRRGP